MYTVRVEQRADALYGIIQRRHRGDHEKLAELEAAYNRLLFDLRSGRPFIWLLSSETYPTGFELYDPPLRVHFRLIDEGIIGVIAFEEIGVS